MKFIHYVKKCFKSASLCISQFSEKYITMILKCIANKNFHNKKKRDSQSECLYYD